MDEPTLFTATPRKARVEIIPLIDVVFFLLATFVLFILSLQKIASLKVPLPQAGTPGIEDTTVYLEASEPGYYFWKEGRLSAAEMVSTAELHSRLVDYQRRTLVPRVLVSGDNHARFGSAVKALDEVRKAGITQLSIETAPPTRAR